MGSYIKDSFKKFKSDALAKGVYDLIKWLFISLLIFAFAKAVPADTKFSQIIAHSFNISFYWIISYSILIALISIIGAYIIFKKKYKQVEQDNFTDELTGLKNHKALKQYLERQLKEVVKYKEANLSLILLDVDGFKQFNSTYGYNVSDQILKEIGQLLGNDKRATDETFRFFNRGDEFLVVANETSANNAFLAAERKRKLIERATFRIGDELYNLKVSCGVTEYKQNDNYQSFTDRVTTALMEAKKEHSKNCSKLII